MRDGFRFLWSRSKRYEMAMCMHLIFMVIRSLGYIAPYSFTTLYGYDSSRMVTLVILIHNPLRKCEPLSTYLHCQPNFGRASLCPSSGNNARVQTQRSDSFVLCPSFPQKERQPLPLAIKACQRHRGTQTADIYHSL